MRFKTYPIVALIFLAGCFHDQNANDADTVTVTEIGDGVVVSNARLTPEKFATLTPEQQYATYNKLLGTLYKGEKAQDFFDLDKGTEKLSVRKSTPIQDILTAINEPTDNYARIIEKADEKYYLDNSNNNTMLSHMSMPLAYMYELPVSQQMFDMWMAYQLTNTILFSPAAELDSTHYIDATTVINNLFFWMQSGLSVKDIVFLHMNSEENWRRFRSPEDNTREMMEIYLLRFNDSEVPPASTACKNWYLTDGDQGYQLVKTSNINTEPQTLLDTDNIYTCEDFYRELTEHPTFIPAVTRRIVDYMIPDESDEARAAMARAVVNTGPREFRDIFTNIIFSEYFLLKANKVKRFEETFFNLAERVDWYASDSYFRSLVNDDAGAGTINLTQINQRAMSYKLGRKLEVPLDTLSFAYYHAKIRGDVLLNQRTSTDPGNTSDSGWKQSYIADDSLEYLSDKEFTDYLFLSVLSRKPTEDELTALKEIVETNLDGDPKRGTTTTYILLDYFSRLPETYMYQAIK